MYSILSRKCYSLEISYFFFTLKVLKQLTKGVLKRKNLSYCLCQNFFSSKSELIKLFAVEVLLVNVQIMAILMKSWKSSLKDTFVSFLFLKLLSISFFSLFTIFVKLFYITPQEMFCWSIIYSSIMTLFFGLKICSFFFVIYRKDTLQQFKKCGPNALLPSIWIRFLFCIYFNRCHIYIYIYIYIYI